MYVHLLARTQLGDVHLVAGAVLEDSDGGELVTDSDGSHGGEVEGERDGENESERDSGKERFYKCNSHGQSLLD